MAEMRQTKSVGRMLMKLNLDQKREVISRGGRV